MRETTLVDSISFAIIVPTHNEAADISCTLDAAIAVHYLAKEVLVVDDKSTDNTTAIVAAYANRGVRLICLPVNRGVAAARNVGLCSTQADVVIILNADVMLPPDFIETLLPYYQQGADFVVVESCAANPEHLFARYVQACHDLDYRSNPVEGRYDWSEGWSCRREIALAVGGFPEELPGASGEDAIFVERLVSRGYRRMYAPNIVVTHQVPHTLRSFWKQRLGRGRGIAYRRFGYKKVTPRLLPMIRAWIGALLLVGTVIYPFWRAARLTRMSAHGWLDWPGMVWAVVLDLLGHQVGYWRGYRAIVRAQTR